MKRGKSGGPQWGQETEPPDVPVAQITSLWRRTTFKSKLEAGTTVVSCEKLPFPQKSLTVTHPYLSKQWYSRKNGFPGTRGCYRTFHLRGLVEKGMERGEKHRARRNHR
ncbi:hypothetical protein QA601_14790 [Chitinispirillales bacterium ANBcel5]|uniref:hypothetical protein n=1 Tax=Cellulosispirillum alkaliphilum TaxID=3039283 RepID=UPI002A535604|nr:hypothetical protein [Chitinispirillales bacterium ANBcel5]